MYLSVPDDVWERINYLWVLVELVELGIFSGAPHLCEVFDSPPERKIISLLVRMDIGCPLH